MIKQSTVDFLDDEVGRLDAENKRLRAALKALEACYCEASDDMSRAQRDHHRKVLMEARTLLQPTI